MRGTCVAIAAAALAGCNVFELAERNVVNEFHSRADERALRQDLLLLAEAAWPAAAVACPEHGAEPAYRDGFVCGYVEFLDAGGPGEPNGMPPAALRRRQFRNVEGARAVEAFYAGFRHGADAAKASGLRETMVVPMPAPAGKGPFAPPAPPPAVVVPPATLVPPPAPTGAGPSGRMPAYPLPPPRPLPEGAAAPAPASAGDAP